MGHYVGGPSMSQLKYGIPTESLKYFFLNLHSQHVLYNTISACNYNKSRKYYCKLDY